MLLPAAVFEQYMLIFYVFMYDCCDYDKLRFRFENHQEWERESKLVLEELICRKSRIQNRA